MALLAMIPSDGFSYFSEKQTCFLRAGGGYSLIILDMYSVSFIIVNFSLANLYMAMKYY